MHVIWCVRVGDYNLNWPVIKYYKNDGILGHKSYAKLSCQ